MQSARRGQAKGVLISLRAAFFLLGFKAEKGKPRRERREEEEERTGRGRAESEI